MDVALFSSEGFLFVLRWLHLVFGVIWIGHLYYFNFVQGEFMKEVDASVKSGVLQKLLPRALWWFRWGAMITMITGVLYLGHRLGSGGMFLAKTSWGVTILTGTLLGLTMWYNVWFIIWPNQKIVIQNAVDTAAGKPANPAAATAAPKALLASRTNTLFSIPMLFFMGAANHLTINIGENSNYTGYWVALLVIWAFLEFNAIKGKLGPLTTVKGVIHMGFVLALVIYGVMEFML